MAVLSFCATSDFAVASSLHAGLAVVEITPPVGTRLAGYGTERPAERIHDPLFARVLLLRARDLSVALVTSDLHRLYAPELVERIRLEVGIEHTILSSSHNHSAPSMEPGNRGTSWAAAVESKIVLAVKRANENLFPAQLSWGQGSLVGAHNVRVLREDGSLWERWTNPEEEVTAPVDPAVSVIRVDQAGGGLRALLVHYSSEPAIFGPDSREISADFPGALARLVEKDLGKGVTCLFAAGAAANIHPFQSRLSGTKAFDEVEKMGRRLGQEAVRVAKALRPADTVHDLKVRKSILKFRHRWQGGSQVELGISTVLIDRRLALVAVPAEMFVEFQISLAARSPSPMSLLLGSAYSAGRSWAGIIPTIAAAAQGGYGASYNTEIEVGAGEAIVDRGLIDTGFLLGKLQDLPKGEWVRNIPDLPSP